MTACHKGVQHTYIYTYVIITYNVNIDSLTKGGAAQMGTSINVNITMIIMNQC
jgi:fructose-specific phosphotransferase system component IIB